MLDLTPLQYLREANQALTLTDSCDGHRQELRVRRADRRTRAACAACSAASSSSAVGDAATSAVVTSIVWIIVADGLFAVIFNRSGSEMGERRTSRCTI